MTKEQELMVINHSLNYLASLAFREALAFVFKHNKTKYMKLIETEHNERKPNWDREL